VTLRYCNQFTVDMFVSVFTLVYDTAAATESDVCCGTAKKLKRTSLQKKKNAKKFGRFMKVFFCNLYSHNNVH